MELSKCCFYIFSLLYLGDIITSATLSNNNYKNIYGDDYGIKWIYFPDGDGVVHQINLTMTEEDYSPQNRFFSDNVEYRLYTGNDTENYIILDQSGNAIHDVKNNTMHEVKISNVPLKIITHGWKSSVDKTGVNLIKNTYLKHRNVNVITVDWHETADSIFYHWVANETYAVGLRIAKFLDELHLKYSIDGEMIHLIGHSLGAHVMGVAASKTSFQVDRITGLDPARPLFEFPERENQKSLDQLDAAFVDVIHTCGGILGFESEIGTVDFYPNNGVAPQPGCDSIQKIFEACSHGRSYEYFAESIQYPKAFPAYQCQDWKQFVENRCSNYGYMGEEIYRNMSGKYYLKTNAFNPFGLRLDNNNWTSIFKKIWNNFHN